MPTTNRGNYDGEPKDFYRNSIFILYLDNLISQLESRFHQINLSAVYTLHLIPKNLDSLAREFQTDIFAYYGEELQNTDCFKQQVRLWKKNRRMEGCPVGNPGSITQTKCWIL